ncbi:MAG TPA: metalloregulator ArsR/SmtB family transcription factor [Thermodesulfovibrionales bacterium]|nr:metalloregulator ArsR/SmtB family transcription factor [Thermodesulfovibrionales bacterium]
MTSLEQRIDILKIIAHPVRIKILKELLKGVKCVTEFGDFLGISQPNVSQHLSLLRAFRIIDYYQNGRLKCYFLIDPMIPDLLQVLTKRYKGGLPKPECCPLSKKVKIGVLKKK